jgi:hypothetical protein
MNAWLFYDFLDRRGNNLMRAWLDSLPAKAAAKIDVRIVYMQSITLWQEKFASALRGWPDLIELRVAFGGAQYRPLGFYGPHPNAFTLVHGVVEKGKLPRRVLEVADGNRKIVLADRSRIRKHEFKRQPAPES